MYLFRGIISIPAPLFKHGKHFVENFLHFFADGAKNGLQGEDLLEVEPLVCRVPVMVSQVVFCAVLFKKLGIILLHHGEVAKD